MKNAEIFKLISLVLALVICLSLCACGGEKEDDYAGLGGLDVGGATGNSGNGGSCNGYSFLEIYI